MSSMAEGRKVQGTDITSAQCFQRRACRARTPNTPDSAPPLIGWSGKTKLRDSGGFEIVHHHDTSFSRSISVVVVNYPRPLPPWLSRSASPASGAETSHSTTSSSPTPGKPPSIRPHQFAPTNETVGRRATPARSRLSARTTRSPSPIRMTTPESFTRISSSTHSVRGTGLVLVHSPPTRHGGYSQWLASCRRSSLGPSRISRRAP